MLINVFTVLYDVFDSDVDDIDVYAGGVAETPADGAAVGPLFSCIIGNQFRDFKDGDRYWYERSGVEGFSKGKKLQLLLKKITIWQCKNAEKLLMYIHIKGKIGENVHDELFTCYKWVHMYANEWRILIFWIVQ